MLLRIEGVVIRSMPYGETSCIATLFTKEAGKLGVLAKGARTTRSRFGATLQVLSHVQAVVYNKPTRQLRLVKECAHIRVRHDIARHLNKMAAAVRMVELTHALTADEAPGPELFDLLVHVLDALNDQDPAHSTALLLYFQARMAKELGFAPNFDKKAVLALGADGGKLELESGRILSHHSAHGASMTASRAALRAFSILHRAALPHVLNLDGATLDETQTLVEEYLRYQTGDAYPTKGGHIVQELRRSVNAT